MQRPDQDSITAEQSTRSLAGQDDVSKDLRDLLVRQNAPYLQQLLDCRDEVGKFYGI